MTAQESLKRTGILAGSGAGATAAVAGVLWLLAEIEEPGIQYGDSWIMLPLFSMFGAFAAIAANIALTSADRRNARRKPPSQTWTGELTPESTGQLASFGFSNGANQNTACLRTRDGRLVGVGNYGKAEGTVRFPGGVQVEAGTTYRVLGHPEGLCDCPNITGAVIQEAP